MKSEAKINAVILRKNNYVLESCCFLALENTKGDEMKRKRVCCFLSLLGRMRHPCNDVYRCKMLNVEDL